MFFIGWALLWGKMDGYPGRAFMTLMDLRMIDTRTYYRHTHNAQHTDIQHKST